MMTKEQHIEAFNNTLLMNYDMPEEFTKDLAEFLYDEGYRLETEGKWISASTKPGVQIGMKCSLCGARIKYSEFFNGNHNYCYKCGAKMKGDQT